MLMARSSETKTCSGILDLLHWLNNRVRGAHEERIAMSWFRQNTRNNQLFLVASSRRQLRT